MAVPVDRKLFRVVSIKSDHDEAAETLALLDKSRMVDSDLEHLWQAHFTDQEVRGVIEELFGTGVPDPSLVSMVRKRAKGLTTKDVRASLARLRVGLDFPVENARERPARRVATKGGAAKTRKEPARAGVQLSDLISAGVIRAPLLLATTYRGRELAASVETDGKISFGGKKYESLSAAGCEARRTVIGGKKRPATNGWAFWKFKDTDGREKPIAELREKYARRAHLKVVR